MIGPDSDVKSMTQSRLFERISNQMTTFIRIIVALGLLLASDIATAQSETPQRIDLGTRRELFVDHFLIERLEGAELKLQPLQPTLPSSEPAMGGHYATVLRDGNLFRQYCRFDRDKDAHWRNGWEEYHLGEMTLYADSKDGVHWNRPNLDLFQEARFPEGNVVVAGEMLVNHNFTPMIDARPGVPAAERYKALGGLHYPPKNWGYWPEPDSRAKLREKYGSAGLYAYVSADGIRWKRLMEKAVIPEDWGSFDSQNVSFWSEAEGQYVCYFRVMDSGYRAVARTTSEDFLQWSKPVLMKGRLEKEHLYTSGTHPYLRAPHIYIAPATRFLPGEDPNTRVILMTTRAGSDTYDRTFGQQQWLADPAVGNRTNYIAYTNGALTGPRELSFYCLGTRYTIRMDGFGSICAREEVGQVVTKPFTFDGAWLSLNYRTRDSGELRVEVQTAEGQPIDGLTLDDCKPLSGDEIDGAVQWRSDKGLNSLAGRQVRLRIALKDADLYALRFVADRMISANPK